MNTPEVLLDEVNDTAALRINGVLVERDRFEAVLQMVPTLDMSQQLQDALALLDWADATPCEHCKRTPSVCTDDDANPCCTDCEPLALGGDCQ